jgi:formylglycine-generating enzyme required for sulfatase activity
VDEPLKPIGFWSYTSSDDKSAGGRLSQLRRLLADELQLQIGRRQQVHIFQDVAAIPHGSDWLKEIHSALGRASFLIPIVTPAFLESEMCCLEVSRFREREAELGRDDLIFPFVYIDLKDIHASEVHDPAVLTLLKSRQWFDFSLSRHRPPDSEEVAAKLAAFAASVRFALRKAAHPLKVPEAPARTTVAPKSTEAAGPVRPDPAVPPLPPPLPGTIIRDGPGPVMVFIPEGRFLMGIPEAESKREGPDGRDARARPVHLVTIARPIWLGKYPVTRDEYMNFAAQTGHGNQKWTDPGFAQDGRHPVVNVSHADALAYIEWLNGETGEGYRLPSEAEWEYAARAGTQTARYWGDAAGKPDEHAHFGVTTGTCEVGLFKPNAFGLFDMLGNVWE